MLEWVVVAFDFVVASIPIVVVLRLPQQLETTAILEAISPTIRRLVHWLEQVQH